MLQFWVRGSVVERVPDKNEVHGSIPCAPTETALDAIFNPGYNTLTFEFGKLNGNLKEIFQKNLSRISWLKFRK